MAVAMGGFQASIGAFNDVHDLLDDGVAKPWKPIPAGRISSSAAAALGFVGGLVGALLSLAAGLPVLLVGLLGYGLGLGYDLRLKRIGWGWLAFALALPLVPVYAWLGAGAGLPPRVPVLAAMGPLAGLALALANGLVDLESDASSGGQGIAVRLGRRRAVGAMAASHSGLVLIAWITSPGSGLATAALAAGTAAIAIGAAWSARPALRWRWLGWQVQAAGVALLAVGWLSGSAS